MLPPPYLLNAYTPNCTITSPQNGQLVVKIRTLYGRTQPMVGYGFTNWVVQIQRGGSYANYPSTIAPFTNGPNFSGAMTTDLTFSWTNSIGPGTPFTFRLHFHGNQQTTKNYGLGSVFGSYFIQANLSNSAGGINTAPNGNRILVASVGNQQQQAQNQQQAQQNQSQNQNQTGSQQTFQQQWAILLGQQQLGRISGRGTTMILKRRFNPKIGKVELIKNGVISRLGYLNLKGKNLNRRQALRNYRYR